MPKVRSIGQMIQCLGGLTEKDGATPWELNFASNMVKVSENGRATFKLTTKQCETVESIHDKYFA